MNPFAFFRYKHKIFKQLLGITEMLRSSWINADYALSSWINNLCGKPDCEGTKNCGVQSDFSSAFKKIRIPDSSIRGKHDLCILASSVDWWFHELGSTPTTGKNNSWSPGSSYHYSKMARKIIQPQIFNQNQITWYIPEKEIKKGW